MNNIITLTRKIRKHRGIALLTVVTLLALATGLILALFTVTQTELKATVATADGASARLHSDMAVNIVMGQIQNAALQNTTTVGKEIWASQPGMVRQFRESGRILSANRLYSSKQMALKTTADTDAAENTVLLQIRNEMPPTDWNALTARYVDMNEPKIQLDPATETQRLVFPILDPRAYNPGDVLRSVEGFSYSDRVDGGTGTVLPGVVLENGNTDNQRLPMPVEWMYMLKDGTLGYLNESNIFTGADGVTATAENPIVSRLAFWTDDESAKININTAGEGTVWNTPRLFHVMDGDWARYQPMMYEYQRYPGHPATTSLSTVLFPGVPMNPYRVNQAGTDDANTPAFTKALEVKETIYSLMPKILPGGSKAGSVPVPTGRNFTSTAFSEVQNALRERLFASVDDFLLLPEDTDTNGRREIDFGDNHMWSNIPRAQVIERLGGFLTVNSKSSELNPFGYPKVAMWPVHNTNSNTFRTVFDRMIVDAASVGRLSSGGSFPYNFVRENSNVNTELTGIQRNTRLHNYLLAVTDQRIPGFAANSGTGVNNNATFAVKYGVNREQILVQIFDYIRSTNLHDDVIAERNVGSSPAIPGLPTARSTAFSTSGGLASGTFTPMRNGKNPSNDGHSSYPGHGQVMPTRKAGIGAGAQSFRGMGRYFTITEAGLQFICTADSFDGRPGGRPAPKEAGVMTRGPGYTPTNWFTGSFQQGGVTVNNWYSNFPPLGATPAVSIAAAEAKRNSPAQRYAEVEGIPGDSVGHPGYNPVYWNYTLQRDNPLPAARKRVQAIFLLEWFCPSAGWGLINPDFMVEIDASQLRVNGTQQLFTHQGGRMLVRPLHNISSAWGIEERGGTTSYRAFLNGRHLPAVVGGSMPADPSWSQYATAAAPLTGCNQYNFVSDFFDVTYDPAVTAPPTHPSPELVREQGWSNGSINLTGGNVTVRIYSNQQGNTPAATAKLQEFTFNFPAAPNTPAPILCISTQQTNDYQNSDGSWAIRRPVPPPYWWAFHVYGAIGRSATSPHNTFFTGAGDELGGRFRHIGAETGDWGRRYGTYLYDDPLDEIRYFREVSSRYNPPSSTPQLRFRGNLAIAEDSIQSIILKHGDGRLIMAQYDVPIDDFEPHRFYGQRRMAHNIVFANRSDGPGYDRGYDQLGMRMVSGAPYNEGFVPDQPYTSEMSTAVNKYGDFDRGVSTQADGAYINKPDEGNTYSIVTSTGEPAVPYYTDGWRGWSGGETYFSPNRQISSPGMFGSLPTGVFQDNTTPAIRGKTKEAWRTLLFRPSIWTQAQSTSATARHLGAPATLTWASAAVVATAPPQRTNNGGVNPPDYLLMDFYWMPVVEPYAISEGATTSGKINLNYQMVPFRHIKRATGLHAVMKSEIITALHTQTDANDYIRRPGGTIPTGMNQRWFWRAGNNTTYGRKYWHREIDIPATLRLFDERFSSGYAFISPAQICEMHLLPKRMDASDVNVPATWSTSLVHTTSGHQAVARTDSIHYFWNQHKLTGENLRERPYANMYPRLTTRSNTYTVHVRAQVIRKARSTQPNVFDPESDSVTAEYRGSTVIERYLDQKDPGLLDLDYAPAGTFSAGYVTTIMNRPSLESFHRFRILSQKKFN